jgi:hypothetical protein
MAIVSRMLGGARTSDLHALDWDRFDFEQWTVLLHNSKIDEDDLYEVHPEARPWLTLWWEHQGKPTEGPVFPELSPPGRPDLRIRRTTKRSYADRLRRDLLIAGITRKELHEDTLKTRRTDFHSLRRGYVSALRVAGVDARTAMAMSRHKSMAVHDDYDTLARGPMRLPDGAAPSLPMPVIGPAPGQAANSDDTPDDSGSSSEPTRSDLRGQTSRDDSSALVSLESQKGGDPSGNRTRVTGVRGRCPNR